MKPLKEQENIKKEASDNENIFLTPNSNTVNTVKKSLCDYLVVYDFEEDE